MSTELTRMTRLHPKTAQRLKMFATSRGVSMSAAVELLLNLADVPPLGAFSWAGEAEDRPKFEAMLAQAEEAGDTRLAAFARDRLARIDAVNEGGEK